MTLPKPALMRAIEDDIPLAKIDKLVSTYIPPTAIADAARGAVTGGDESGNFGGVTRYLFVGENRPFVDPSGILLYLVRSTMKRFARSADPVAMKARAVTRSTKPPTKTLPGGAI